MDKQPPGENKNKCDRLREEVIVLRELAVKVKLYRKKKLMSLRLDAYDLIDEWERKYREE